MSFSLAQNSSKVSSLDILMLSNLEVNCYNLLIFTALVPSCIACKPGSMINLYIRDPFKFFHSNNIEYTIATTLNIAFIALQLKLASSFCAMFPFTNKIGWSLPTILNKEPYSLIQGFQKGFHLNLPISIVIPIKMRRDQKRVIVFHDSKGQ